MQIGDICVLSLHWGVDILGGSYLNRTEAIGL